MDRGFRDRAGGGGEGKLNGLRFEFWDVLGFFRLEVVGQLF